MVAGVGTVLLLRTSLGLGFVGKLGIGNRGGDGGVGLPEVFWKTGVWRAGVRATLP